MALTATDVDSLTTVFIIPRAVQNYFKANPFWFRLKRKGIRFEGGTEIRAPIFYDKLVAGGSYRDRQPLNTTNNTVITHAKFDLQEYYVHLSVSGRDKALNGGKAAVKNFAKLKMLHAKDQLADILGTDTQGSNGSGIDLDGLGLVMSAASTYGNVAPADVPTWKANILAATANTMSVAKLQTVLGQCTFGGSRPTLIASRQSVYDKFSTFGDTVQRIVDTDMASVGIAQLNFRGIPWVVDNHIPGSDGGATDNVVEFINEDYFELWIHDAYNFITEKLARVAGEDVDRWQILMKGNLIGHSRRHQGELTSIDPAL